jgi:hypothetical protein
MSIIIPVLIGGGPLIYWYYHQEETLFLIAISVFLLPFAFLPCYITSFIMIKYYKEDNSGSLFRLYFIYLWDTFRRIWRLELVIIPIVILFLYSGYYYWMTLGPEYFEFNGLGILSIFCFALIFFLLMAMFFAFLHLPMAVSYFRMKTMGYLRLIFIMAFRYILKTLMNIALFLAPMIITLILFQSEMIRLLYLLFGFSVPQYFMYISTRELYWYLSNNIDDIRTSDKYES